MNEPHRSALWRRLLWFIALWAFGVASVATVAYAIRYFIAR